MSPTPLAPTSRTALIIAFATIYLVWGSTYLAIRVAVETIPPFLMAGTRFTLAGTLLLAFLRWRGHPWPTARQWGINAVIGTFLLLGGNGLVVWAEQTIPSGITALLIGVGPLFIVLTEWAWPGGQRPGLMTFAALLIGFAGVTWLAAPWEDTVQGGFNPAGMIAILAACCFWGIGSIYSRHAHHGANAFIASALQMLGGGGALLLVAALHGDFHTFDHAHVSAASVRAFFYLVGMGSLVGFSTFVWLMKHAAPARVATYAYVNPIVAVFLGWLLLDEPIGPRTLGASAVIVTAVAMITMQQGKAAAAPAAERKPAT